ncbi:MAG: RHS repeat-associated core domain-containing protein, partial [Acidobacteria bacterium]|nr:RHS repeat-associated core domain-containing protein [Acidobacteriota bacterium]
GALTRYMYNEEDIWLAITPSGTAIHYHHGPGIDEPLVAWTSYDGGYYEPLYYFADGLGSIRAAKGQDWLGRDMSASYEFDSFGQITSSTSTLKAEWPLFTYTAREADSETGTLFLRNRFYDAHTGRFTAEDPRGIDEAVNFYAYVQNDPVNNTDPSGESRLKACWNCIKYGRRCTRDRADCARRHSDPAACLERGEDDVGDASAHVLRWCAKDAIPSCLDAAYYCIACGPRFR